MLKNEEITFKIVTCHTFTEINTLSMINSRAMNSQLSELYIFFFIFILFLLLVCVCVCLSFSVIIRPEIKRRTELKIEWIQFTVWDPQKENRLFRSFFYSRNYDWNYSLWPVRELNGLQCRSLNSEWLEHFIEML